MPRRGRESTWLVISRCLAIIRRVQRGPATWKELVEAVRREVGEEAYGKVEGKALNVTGIPSGLVATHHPDKKEKPPMATDIR